MLLASRRMTLPLNEIFKGAGEEKIGFLTFFLKFIGFCINLKPIRIDENVNQRWLIYWLFGRVLTLSSLFLDFRREWKTR